MAQQYTAEQNPDGVQVTQEVFNGLEAVRRSGMTNMLDRNTVLMIAREWGFEATADWIESAGRKTYGELIFRGPQIVD